MSCNTSISLVGDLPNSNSLIGHGGCCLTVDGSSPDDLNLKKSNYLSEFITLLDKALARKNLGIPDSFQLRWGNLEGNLDELKDLYNKFLLIEADIEKLEFQVGDNLKEELNKIKDLLDTKISKELEGTQANTLIEYSNENYPGVKTLKDALDLALYKDTIINITCSPSVLEEGLIISLIDYQWDINKSSIVSQAFDGIQLDNSVRDYVLSGNFSSTFTKILTVDDGVKVIELPITLPFYPGLYYGSSDKETLTTADIIDFEYKLIPSRHTSVTVNATEYLYICIPYSYGAATFKVGGFEGGFLLVDDQFIFNKYKGILYRIYRSDNKNLGVTTVTIL